MLRREKPPVLELDQVENQIVYFFGPAGGLLRGLVDGISPQSQGYFAIVNLETPKNYDVTPDDPNYPFLVPEDDDIWEFHNLEEPYLGKASADRSWCSQTMSGLKELYEEYGP